ncbi:MAG: RHS repeat-associated core domain-containing protein, partial [Candidatus Marinimicrobia bacterium]|nr:RHS repeat-associated core domain-containing protein [Candidatus Neomarinimicrobiota bacterium]
EIPTVSLHDDVPSPDTELSFDFDKFASVDANRFYFYFMNSETGAYFRVHYYRRSHTINVGQYSVANGYEDIYTNTSFYEDDGNCKFVIVDGDIITFYFDGVLKGATSLDDDINDLNAVKILVKEGHFHYDDIIVDQIFNAGTPSEYTTNIVDLDFSDGPYAQFADYYYNTNDERILTVKSQEAASYYPFKTYIYNGNGQTLCEYKINKSASYSFLNDYVYGNGQKLAKFDGSDIEYYHNNYLGSIQAMTNGSGSVMWSRDYYPFGDEKGSGTGSADDNAYKFTGKEWDTESDFFYSWHRYYDPSIGRFIQVDPLWSRSLYQSPYNYCNNNPLIAIDPDGLSTEYCQLTGDILKVLKDGSLDVWTVDKNSGERIVTGKTEFWNEFNDRQRLNLDWGPVDNFMNYLQERYVYGKSPISVGVRSAFGVLDVKENFLDANVGYLYDGYWMTGQSVGNRLAGKNAAILGMPWQWTIKASGELHMWRNKTKEYINAGYYGEDPYAGRQIQSGYFSILLNEE